MAEQQHDLVVIGGGPGGYVAAIRAAQLGLDVAVVEERRTLGGTCLNIGCIPSKALLESSHRFAQARDELAAHGVKTGRVRLDLETMLGRKDEIVARVTQGIAALFWKWKIHTYTGRARLLAPGRLLAATGSGDVEIAARNIIIATGSLPATLPGVALDGERIATSTEALAYHSVPDHLVVIGAGAIGLELGSVWRRLGAKVTVLEYLDRILPGMDAEIAAGAQKTLVQQGLSFHLGLRVTAARVRAGECVVEAEGRPPFTGSHVLVAVGRRPRTEELGLEAAGIAVDERGQIPVDARFATTAPGVYAIGDVIRGPMLAHKASEEGIACVEGIVTGHGRVNYDAVPNIVYTWPEVAGVGATEEALREQGVPYRKGTFPFLANGRAHALGELAGQVKILAHMRTDRVLGVHILGPHAGDLIAEAATAIEFGASSEDLARACHAHPTLAEAIKEAALAVDRRAIHL
jgi:dihydrolipoamide dehydrogenase